MKTFKGKFLSIATHGESSKAENGKGTVYYNVVEAIFQPRPKADGTKQKLLKFRQRTKAITTLNEKDLKNTQLYVNGK